MSEGWERVKQAVTDFISRPSPQPPFVGAVGANPDDGLAAGREFVPEASYFSVRLVDMRLAEGGKYFVDFLPLGVCVAEYTYGTERRRVPLVLSNDKVKQMLEGAAGDAGHVQFTNIPVVRRAPFKEDNLALFVGLFRMPYSDIGRSVLQLAADVSEELGGAALGAAVGIGTKLYDRVTGMFSLNKVEPRFAYLDGMALSKSGYVLVSGPLPEGVPASEFIVADKRLKRRGGNGNTMPDGFDYCVLAIEHRASLLPSDADAEGDAGKMLAALAALPFHRHWQSVSKLLALRKSAEADEALLTLRGEVVTSPDLSEQDRLIAIAGYDLAYAKYAQPLLAKPGEKVPATRGYRNGSPAGALKEFAYMHKKQGGDGRVATALDAIALQLQAGKIDVVPSGGIPEAALAGAFAGVRDAMSSVWKQGVGAKSLANALTAATVRVD